VAALETAANLTQTQVHPALGVGKHPVAEQALQQALCPALIVALLHPHQDHQAAIDLAHDPALYLHPALAHPLQQADHRNDSAKRSVASTSALRMPGSLAEWPASGITFNTLSGQAWCSSQAEVMGQIRS